MRRRVRSVSVPLGFVCALLLSASCTPVDDRAGEPPPTPTGSILGQSCDAPRDGYRVHYPDAWHVNDIEQSTPCTWFHPEPFDLPEHGEVMEIAIMVTVEDGEFAERARSLTEAPDVAEVLSREETTVAGQAAIRTETERSGEAFYPEGTEMTSYLVDWDEGVLSAVTTSAASGDHQANVEVLDEMMRSLEQVDFDATCSAAAFPAEPSSQSGLPGPVARTRAEIVDRAVACDFEGLARIAEGTEDGFTYSFGDAGDPAGFWSRQEQQDVASAPMRYLVSMLERSYGTIDVQGQTQYVWPAAFAYESWDEVPDEEEEELRPLYTEVELRGFERFGGYGGYRIGIDVDGNWLFFVAGD